MNLPFFTQLEDRLQEELGADPETGKPIAFEGPNLAVWISAYLKTRGYPELAELMVVNGRYYLTLKERL